MSVSGQSAARRFLQARGIPEDSIGRVWTASALSRLIRPHQACSMGDSRRNANLFQ
jgi:hypothetical protein